MMYVEPLTVSRADVTERAPTLRRLSSVASTVAWTCTRGTSLARPCPIPSAFEPVERKSAKLWMACLQHTAPGHGGDVENAIDLPGAEQAPVEHHFA